MALEVKICGITCLDDARAALEFGADFLGFVLYPESPRGIPPRRLRQIAACLPESAALVGVFVNEPAATVAAIVGDCRLRAAQIHGDEPAEAFAGAGIPLWRAIHFSAGAFRPEPGRWPAERYVLDARTPGRYGGTGTRIDWTAAARLARRVPAMLAGGLGPETVAEAIRAVRPLGVDAASGVEAAPGRKDHDRLRQFIRAARAAAGPGDEGGGQVDVEADR